MIDQTLSHYRIVAEIGAGGVGEVYRAHDEHLDRDVALKLLRVGVLGDEGARKRFRKEALALSKLNHPNIATIFDFDTQDGVDFLAMELIPGSSLSEKLKAGPLSEQDVIRLGTQFAEGLAAAHAHGIVHRDLKPGNLMVTPEGRLKILDFGLAALLHPFGDPDMTRSITETQSVSGTLPYMSPEQLRGQPTDARSDVYAAGAVLYEMATGQRPFPQSQGAELIGAILHESPPPPSAHNRLVPPALESVILKTLDKEPARRYQSARELHAALEAQMRGEMPPPIGRRRFGDLAAATALVLILLVGVGLGLNVGRVRERLASRVSPGKGGDASPSASVQTRRSVAVLGFKNVSGRPDAAWLTTGLSEMLTTELGAGERVRTVSEENVARAKMDLSLSDADSLAKDTLARVRKNLGTDYVVLGSYVDLGKEAGGQIRLDLRLQDARDGETIGAVSVMGTTSQLFDLVSKAGTQLREKLGVGALSEAEASSVRAALSSNPEAERLYAEGLAKLRVFDALAARELLEKAVAADPNYALAHSALAAAWSGLGYDVRAREEAKKAFDLSASLPREQRLLIEGRFREVSGGWGKAVEMYKSLIAFFPDNVDYGLRLANAQSRSGNPKDALGTVESLRKLSAPSGDDPRIDVAEGEAARILADFKREKAAGETAATKGETQGAQLLVARALDLQGFALWKLGQPGPAASAFERAKQIYATAGDRNGVATELNRMAVVRWDQGDLDAAEKLYEESLAMSRESGNQAGIASALNNLALVLWSRGDLARAAEMDREASLISRKTANRWGEAITRANHGDILSAQGDLKGARKDLEQAIAGFRQLGDKSNTALQLSELASVRYKQGDLVAAKKIQQEGFDLGQATGDKRTSAWALSNLGDIAADQGDLVKARKNYEEALRLQNEIGEKGPAAYTRITLAALSLDEGQPMQANVGAIREALEEFDKEKSVDGRVFAHVVLARVLLAQGKLPDARKEIEAAEAIALRSQSLGVHLNLEITAGRVRAKLGETGLAKTSLQTALAKATKAGFAGYQLEARLALGNIAMQSGDAAQGRDWLAALEKDASTKGFVLIAHKAHDAASGH